MNKSMIIGLIATLLAGGIAVVTIIAKKRDQCGYLNMDGGIGNERN